MLEFWPIWKNSSTNFTKFTKKIKHYWKRREFKNNKKVFFKYRLPLSDYGFESSNIIAKAMKYWLLNKVPFTKKKYLINTRVMASV